MRKLEVRFLATASIASGALLLLLGAAPAASQAARIFGSGFVHDPNQPACEMLGPCTVVAFHEIPGEGQNTEEGSPIDGVITKFRIAAKVETPTQVTFRIANVTPANDGKGGESATATAAGAGPTVTLRRTIEEEEQPPERTPIQEFPGRLPVKKGQHLALDGPSNLSATYDSSSDKFSYEDAPPLVDGSGERASSKFLGELLVQATVEPDADGDGFGDETQDACPSQKATQGACDRTKPSISGLRVKRGKISYRLSEPAKVSIAIAKRARRHFKQIGRKFSGPGRKGANGVRLPRARALVPGAYRVTVTATDPAGNGSVRKAAFKIAG
jgi:hypothetical protein